jgi:hypothetical protein
LQSIPVAARSAVSPRPASRATTSRPWSRAAITDSVSSRQASGRRARRACLPASGWLRLARSRTEGGRRSVTRAGWAPMILLQAVLSLQQRHIARRRAGRAIRSLLRRSTPATSPADSEHFQRSDERTTAFKELLVQLLAARRAHHHAPGFLGGFDL